MFLHVLGDALGSVGAIITGLIVYFVEDPRAVYGELCCFFKRFVFFFR